MNSQIIASPIGNLHITVENNHLVQLEFTEKQITQPATLSTLSKHIASEIHQYFNNPKYQFDINLKLAGSPFQQRVWQALTSIPSGETVTYGALAKSLGTGARAIGRACRTNPIPLIIPCHRIVGMKSIGGFAGQKAGRLLAIKERLLAHESHQNI